MPFLDMRNKQRNFNMQVLITGIFIGLSYTLSLLPLALFAIAQTLAIFGKRYAFLLSFFVVLCLCILAFLTRFSPFILGAFFSLVSVPLFLIVSILRKNNTSVLWSAGVLVLPILLFFAAILSAPTLNQEQYTLEIQKIESTLQNTQKQIAQVNPENDHMYDKTFEQLEILKRDSSLQSFMGYTFQQRLLYFIYGDGFAILLSILLTFFASLFFLDFAFEQIEKLQAIKRYVSTKAQNAFDASFLALLKGLKFDGSEKTLPREQGSYGQVAGATSDFNIVRHSKIDFESESEKRFLGVLKKPRPTNTILLRDYFFYYTGKAPGWGLKTYQMPLILSVLSIMVLAGTVFYFGNFQNILHAIQTTGLFSTLILILSVLSVCALAFLVLQGIFTTLKWIPFGLLVFISIVFLIVSPYIMIDMGSYLFLGIFGVIGLLGYLKK